MPAPDGGGPPRPARTEPNRVVLPVAALFALACALVVGKDLYGFPDRLTMLGVNGAAVKYPAGLHLHVVVLALGMAFGLAAAAVLLLGGALARLRRRAIAATVGLGVVGAVFFAQVVSPVLGGRLSTRDLLAAYRELGRPGEPLGVVGAVGPGVGFYAEDYEPLVGRGELMKFLARPERVFALVRRGQKATTELCSLRKSAATSGQRFYLVDDANEQFLLVSNQLRPGEVDRNPLAGMVLRRRPADVGQPVDVVFEDAIRLIGVSLPRAVDRGDAFEVTVAFEMLKPTARNWKMFVHFDGGGARFQGDHEPIDGLCGLSTLQAGDVVLDRFTIKAGSMASGTPKGEFAMLVGFFVGGSGNYTNMKVTKGQPDGNNRVRIGSVAVR